jgi:hypothetical protein
MHAAYKETSIEKASGDVRSLSRRYECSLAVVNRPF